MDHLLYLPILGQTRPSDLYYYQGAGLNVLYGFTYKYLPLEQFLGQLTRLQMGDPLADRLAKVYSQAWYPGDEPLFIMLEYPENHGVGAPTTRAQAHIYYHLGLAYEKLGKYPKAIKAWREAASEHHPHGKERFTYVQRALDKFSRYSELGLEE